MDLLMVLDPADPSFGDLTFVNGPLPRSYTTQELVEVVTQRLFIRLRTFRDEWFLDTAYGVPYHQRILGKKVPKANVDLIFQEQILAENGVKEITFFQSTLVKRQYSLTFKVKCIDGRETPAISINPIN